MVMVMAKHDRRKSRAEQVAAAAPLTLGQRFSSSTSIITD
jgi:hypothetical protein